MSDLGPVSQSAIDAAHLDMRRHTEDTSSYFLLEPIHDGHHSNQGGHAERDTQQRDQRDE